MSQTDQEQQWSISAEGTVTIGETLLSIDYLQRFNLVFVATAQSGVLVYDAISWTLIKKSDVSGMVFYLMPFKFLPD